MQQDRPLLSSFMPPATASSAHQPLMLTQASFPTIAARHGVAFRFILSAILSFERGRVDFRLPDGAIIGFEAALPGPSAIIEVKNMRFAERVVKGGDNGFAEAYIAGEWDSPDVTAVLEVMCANVDAVNAFLGGKPLLRLARYVQHLWRSNTRRQAKRNISAHYDLGNEFYAAWLDRSMTYSSAIFAAGDNDLSTAQERKYRTLAQAIDLRPGHRVLEIGCGWGGFAEFAARDIGCEVTGLTISREQYDYATARLAKAGLSQRARIKFQDYRDETGTYDRVVSIEMFEAVGERYWPAFFNKMNEVLAAGGRAGLQIITIQERFFDHYRRDIDFIRRHIFPGGMLPTSTILQRLGQEFGLMLGGHSGFARDYAHTLNLWRQRFDEAWPRLQPMGFDERFKRLWRYYLHYCEAGFSAGTIDVRQFVFNKS